MAAQGVSHWMQACVVLQLILSEAKPAAASAIVRNYYETLNVEKSATDSQIRKAFRTLAIKYHPDKDKSVDAEKTFREIVEAYTVLSNKKKKSLYDMQGHKAFLKHGLGMEDADLFSDFDDFVDETPFQDREDECEGSLYEFCNLEEPGFSFYFESAEEPFY